MDSAVNSRFSLTSLVIGCKNQESFDEFSKAIGGLITNTPPTDKTFYANDCSSEVLHNSGSYSSGLSSDDSVFKATSTAVKTTLFQPQQQPPSLSSQKSQQKSKLALPIAQPQVHISSSTSGSGSASGGDASSKSVLVDMSSYAMSLQSSGNNNTTANTMSVGSHNNTVNYTSASKSKRLMFMMGGSSSFSYEVLFELYKPVPLHFLECIKLQNLRSSPLKDCCSDYTVLCTAPFKYGKLDFMI